MILVRIIAAILLVGLVVQACANNMLENMGVDPDASYEEQMEQLEQQFIADVEAAMDEYETSISTTTTTQRIEDSADTSDEDKGQKNTIASTSDTTSQTGYICDDHEAIMTDLEDIMYPVTWTIASFTNILGLPKDVGGHYYADPDGSGYVEINERFFDDHGNIDAELGGIWVLIHEAGHVLHHRGELPSGVPPMDPEDVYTGELLAGLWSEWYVNDRGIADCWDNRRWVTLDLGKNLLHYPRLPSSVTKSEVEYLFVGWEGPSVPLEEQGVPTTETTIPETEETQSTSSVPTTVPAPVATYPATRPDNYPAEATTACNLVSPSDDDDGLVFVLTEVGYGGRPCRAGTQAEFQAEVNGQCVMWDDEKCTGWTIPLSAAAIDFILEHGYWVSADNGDWDGLGLPPLADPPTHPITRVPVCEPPDGEYIC